MSNYIPNKQKKNKIFHKRETELKHAIKHQFENEKIEAAATRLREAKLAAIQAQYAETRNTERSRLRGKWETMTNDEIIDKYSKGLESQRLLLAESYPSNLLRMLIFMFALHPKADIELESVKRPAFDPKQTSKF